MLKEKIYEKLYIPLVIFGILILILFENYFNKNISNNIKTIKSDIIDYISEQIIVKEIEVIREIEVEPKVIEVKKFVNNKNPNNYSNIKLN